MLFLVPDAPFFLLAVGVDLLVIFGLSVLVDAFAELGGVRSAGGREILG